MNTSIEHDCRRAHGRFVLCLVWVLVGLAWLWCGGCAETPQPVTLASWQQSVERYVWDQGNGDPNVLRDLSWDDVHTGFAMMSDSQPARSTDAIGLLLGHPNVGKTHCFVFLVALVHQQRLDDLRPVALRAEEGRFRWSIGPSDSQSLQAYRRYEGAANFSGPSEAFQLDVQNEQISITHLPSGSSWRVPVPTD